MPKKHPEQPSCQGCFLQRQSVCFRLRLPETNAFKHAPRLVIEGIDNRVQFPDPLFIRQTDDLRDYSSANVLILKRLCHHDVDFPIRLGHTSPHNRFRYLI